MARDLSVAGAGGPQRQSVALFCRVRGRHHRADPGIDAGRRGRPDRTDGRGRRRLYRCRSQQIAALDAGGIRREHGVADRRRLRVLDRLSQEPAWPPHRAGAGAAPRHQHARPRLCGRDVRLPARAGDAVQHRAERRHRLSHHQQHPAHLRLRAGADRRQDRHLCDVDRVRGDGDHELAVRWRQTQPRSPSPRRRSASM